LTQTFITKRTKRQDLASRNSLGSSSLKSKFRRLHSSEDLNNTLPRIFAVKCIEQKIQNITIKNNFKRKKTNKKIKPQKAELAKVNRSSKFLI